MEYGKVETDSSMLECNRTVDSLEPFKLIVLNYDRYEYIANVYLYLSYIHLQQQNFEESIELLNKIKENPPEP